MSAWGRVRLPSTSAGLFLVAVAAWLARDDGPSRVVAAGALEPVPTSERPAGDPTPSRPAAIERDGDWSTVAGTIVSAGERRPLTGIAVAVVAGASPVPAGANAVFSDAAGRFRLADVPGRGAYLWVGGLGVLPARFPVGTIGGTVEGADLVGGILEVDPRRDVRLVRGSLATRAALRYGFEDERGRGLPFAPAGDLLLVGATCPPPGPTDLCAAPATVDLAVHAAARRLVVREGQRVLGVVELPPGTAPCEIRL